jgi:hypothetical protein
MVAGKSTERVAPPISAMQLALGTPLVEAEASSVTRTDRSAAGRALAYALRRRAGQVITSFYTLRTS